MVDVTEEELQRRRGLGLRLKAARERVGLTQTDVAERFGVKKATVSAWETGGGLPDALRLARLAKLYKVSADALLWDDSLTPDAMQIAALFDSLSDNQQRMFRAMWMAYFAEAKTDAEVEQAFKNAPKIPASPINEREKLILPNEKARSTHKKGDR